MCMTYSPPKMHKTEGEQVLFSRLGGFAAFMRDVTDLFTPPNRKTGGEHVLIKRL